MRLRLVQLPSVPSLGIYPTYHLAATIQTLIHRAFLDTKDARDRVAAGRPPREHTDPNAPCQPTVISFTPSPTYTLGRRQDLDSFTADDIKRLEAPLTLRVPSSAAAEEDGDGDDEYTYMPSIRKTLRGGLTTYHGPGQAVLWPILDLKSPYHKHFTVRQYSRLLETTTATTLQRRFGIKAFTTEDPGLWVRTPSGTRGQEEERKIGALGVHLRRFVTSLGVSVNLETPTTRSVLQGTNHNTTATTYDERTNPWARFTPCGLDGKGVASVAEVDRLLHNGNVPAKWDLKPTTFAATWAETLAEFVGLPDANVEVADRDTVAKLI